LYIERAGFKQNVSTRSFEPLANVAARLGRGSGPVAVQDGERIKPFGISDPTGAARGHAGQSPAHVVAAAQLGFLGDE
jgi:hypothetical protein